jgi:ubiquitin carboxyl-terminal hydrolase 34
MTYSDSDEMLEDESPLQSFLVAYTSLTLRMTKIDHQTLIENFDDAGPLTDLVSERYLQTLHQVMGYGYPFWKQLLYNTNHGCKTTITAMMTRFMQPPEDGLSLVTRVSKEILDHSGKVPVLIQKFFVHINIVNRFMQHYRMLQNGKTKVDETLELSLRGLPTQAHQYFLMVDERFKDFITKQVPALSIDVSQGFVSHLSSLLRQVAGSDEQLMREMMSERLIMTQHLTREESTYLVELAWKFDVLKKCVVDGRMEIRVQGVDTMQVELVAVYTKFISNGPAQRDHPIPQYLSDFMLANKLVEYFVSVESHPQLITRCGNILGFLVVTHRYTENESDTIWRAVTSSQDSHFVDTILSMMPNIFHIAQYHTLLYLTTKLNELPIHAFNGSMLAYGRLLLRQLRDLWKFDPNNQKMAMPPFDLCIRLIRQSAVEGSLEAPRKREVHSFATSELSHLLAFGPSDADRKVIYHDCIEDISGHTDFASGSISAINALLSHGGDIPSLTNEGDFARLIVGDFAHTIEAERSSRSSSQMLDERLLPRLTLIQTIILYVPDTIPPDTATLLWEYVVGSQALSTSARDTAWMMIFLLVIRKINHRNSFIDQCVKEHLLRLQPRFYTEGCLAFAREVSNYHLRTVSRLGDSVKEGPTAADLLWQLSLTAPSGTIERQAIETLVALYLDTPENQRRSRAETEAIHIGVVERCIRQLTSAASKLKAFSDGTSSGEDEPMVIVASDNEVQLQKLSFSRSLTVLKEFIGGIRARPRYSPQIQTKPHIFHPPRQSKGVIIQIRYQCFGTSTSADMRTIEAGDLETLQDFIQRLKSLTGFSKLTLITGGQKVELPDMLDKTLQELKIDQKGLLIVRQDADAESVPDLASTLALRPAEVEVLTYFPHLYQFLTMEEELGKEVGCICTSSRC